MKILFVGQVVPEEEIGNCSAYSVAGDIMQKNIIKGLEQKDGVSVDVVSVLPNAAFPRDKSKIVASKGMYDNVEINNVGYSNIPGIKQISQMRAMYKFAYSKAKHDMYDCILCYNMYPQFGKTALKLEKKLNVPLVSVLADLPVECIDVYKGINKILFVPLKRVTMGNIRKLKHGIVLNKNVKKYMHKEGDYIVVPGGVEGEKILPFAYREVAEKRIIYAGALSEYSGVRNLIKAVCDLKIENASLEIYGNGDLKGEIEAIAEGNTKVKYMGVRPITEMRKIMETAWILVNPRSVDDPVSSVTFPSKTFEYIMCRRPVIATEFSGCSEKFKEITVACGKGTSKEIEEAICKIDNLSEEELKQFVCAAYDYVTNEMSWSKQTDRIYEYLEKVVSGECKER